MQTVTDYELRRRFSHHVQVARGGESLNSFAKRCGTDPRTIQLIERGERIPGLLLATKIADAVGVELPKLLKPVPANAEVPS